MKKRFFWLVIIILLLSAIPIALVFNMTGYVSVAPGIVSPCPCKTQNGELVYPGCYQGNNMDYTSYYCEVVVSPDGSDMCSLASSCNLCGCPDGKICSYFESENVYSCTDRPLLDEFSCADRTPNNYCSINKPYFCVNNVLVKKCDICGCKPGYLCGTGGSCLIDAGVINQTNQTNDIPRGNSLIIWDDIGKRNITNITLTQRQQEILLSGKRIMSEIVDTKNLDDKIGVDYDTLLQTETKIRQNKNKLEALYLTNEISGELTKSVLDQAAQPLLSPNLDCIGYESGSCLGISECCEGFVCNAGVCVSNLDVKSKEIDISANQKVLEDEIAVSNLVEVKTPLNIDLNVVKYETHPNYVKENMVPNGVSFGFYDIDVDQQTDAEISFEINNDVLVLNQINSIAAYRLVDDMWEQLDLLKVSYGDRETIFTFRTEGFSYFEIIGDKDIPSTLTVSSGTPLWAVYKKSYEPGVSIVEFSFDNKDKLSFGRISGVPFIDLGFEVF